jgi:enoyl-CoA hydratase
MSQSMTRLADDGTTTFEIAGGIASLTFNRPVARNAMTWGMYDALADACARVDSDDGIRIWILRGAGGKAFVSGTDISQFESFRSREDGLRYEERIEGILDRLERVGKPTIAQVEGVATGGGCAIALACDFRVATPESAFGVPIARTLGNCLSSASCARFMDIVGPAIVKDILFTGRLVAAPEALALGMVSRVAPADEIDQVVQELASTLAANAPLTIRATKEMLRRLSAKRRLSPGADADLVELCYSSEDFREGVTAFLAKRKPRWTGR